MEREDAPRREDKVGVEWGNIKRGGLTCSFICLWSSQESADLSIETLIQFTVAERAVRGTGNTWAWKSQEPSFQGRLLSLLDF